MPSTVAMLEGLLYHSGFDQPVELERIPGGLREMYAVAVSREELLRAARESGAIRYDVAGLRLDHKAWSRKRVIAVFGGDEALAVETNGEMGKA